MLIRTEIAYSALALCILSNCTVEQAFDHLAPDPDADQQAIRVQDTEDMIALKETLSCQDIAEIYNISPDSVWRRIRRYQQRRCS